MRFTKLLILLSFFCVVLGFGKDAFAADYSCYVGQFATNYSRYRYYPSAVNVIGYNETQGFTKSIPGTLSHITQSGNYLYYFNYTLPDDGSLWRVQGSVSFFVGYTLGGEPTTYHMQHMPIDTAVTTPGTFSGVSVGQAVTAANSAKASADLASNNALNAYNSVNNANGSAITAVRDANGTVLQEVRNANTRLNSLESTVTNIQNNLGGDNTPPLLKIKTFSGALATSGNKIATYIMVTDTTPGPYYYRINGGSYDVLPVNGVVDLPVTKLGNNVIFVTVKDQAGNETTDAITIRGL